MTQSSAAKRREDVDEVAGRVSFTVETTVLPSFARQRFVNLGGSSSRMTQDSAAKRREVIDEVAARGLMGAKRRGGGTVQSWVKPEVDPPIGCALPREVVKKSFEWIRLRASRLRRDTGFIVLA
jgi:hypothetical protein